MGGEKKGSSWVAKPVKRPNWKAMYLECSRQRGEAMKAAERGAKALEDARALEGYFAMQAEQINQLRYAREVARGVLAPLEWSADGKCPCCGEKGWHRKRCDLGRVLGRDDVDDPL
jgi:hypothetical protein